MPVAIETSFYQGQRLSTSRQHSWKESCRDFPSEEVLAADARRSRTSQETDNSEKLDNLARDSRIRIFGCEGRIGRS